MTMRKVLSTVVLVGACLALGACNKQQDSETPAEVKPKRPPTPSGTMGLRGEYSRSGATTGMFRDCTTGERWPVADEGNNGLLDGAYVASGVPPGTPLVVTVEGGIDYRPSPGGGREMMLIVARFVQIGPGDTCADRP